MYAVAILNDSMVSCCGFKEAYQYRSGEVSINKDNGHEMVTDEYFGAGYLSQNTHVGKSEVSLEEAAKQCVAHWVKTHKDHIKFRNDVHNAAASMRTFNFVKHDKEDRWYSPELRDEVAKIQCRKHVMSYVNANTGRLIETHILIIDKDTSYGQV